MDSVVDPEEAKDIVPDGVINLTEFNNNNPIQFSNHQQTHMTMTPPSGVLVEQKERAIEQLDSGSESPDNMNQQFSDPESPREHQVISVTNSPTKSPQSHDYR